MGEVVGAGLLAHVPRSCCRRSSGASSTTGRTSRWSPGCERLRTEVFDVLDYDTVVVLDSHWATTVEFVVTAQDRAQGLFTSEELPRGMCQHALRLPRATPSWRTRSPRTADDHGTWITAIDDHYLPVFYATTNLWEYLGRGCRTSAGSRSASARPPTPRTTCALGRALGDAIAATDRRVVLIASGALSPHVLAAAAAARARGRDVDAHLHAGGGRAADEERIDWFQAGDHARVLDTMPEFYRFKPEARFGHYLMMVGALGEERLHGARPAVQRVRELGRHRSGAPVVRPAGRRGCDPGRDGRLAASAEP